MLARPVIVIVGPTAVGKSRLALDLAQEFSAAIVTADSRQVYRYMDIGTAKPPREEQALVPHYMLDLVEPSDTYTAGRFREEGTRVLDRLEGEGRPVFVVGGTGFYVRALLDGMTPPAVAPNDALRAVLRAEATERGPEALHRRLALLDSASAARIHPHNLPRLVRALEIIETTGRPVPAVAGTQVPALYLGLTMDRGALRDIADRRIKQQIASGLVEETELLLAMGYDPDSPALSGFGYRQMIRYLRAGLSLEEAITQYQHATHQYIRRQMTWFRANPRIHWIDARTNPRGAATQLIRKAIDGV